MQPPSTNAVEPRHGDLLRHGEPLSLEGSDQIVGQVIGGADSSPSPIAYAPGHMGKALVHGREGIRVDIHDIRRRHLQPQTRHFSINALKRRRDQPAPHHSCG